MSIELVLPSGNKFSLRSKNNNYTHVAGVLGKQNVCFSELLDTAGPCMSPTQ